jgi:hypothetical protein
LRFRFHGADKHYLFRSGRDLSQREKVELTHYHGGRTVTLEQLASSRGLKVVDRGQGHIQLTGGPLLVNYYPLAKKRSAYVAGTTGRRVGVTPEQVVEMCFNAPTVNGTARIDPRSGKSRNKRRVMMAGRKQAKCHWCPTMITLDTSTIDHVIPLYRGGLDNANNRVLSCEPCNNRRGHAMPELKGASR